MAATFCDNCQARDCSLFICSKCSSRSYCGRECQVSHWKKSHKKECGSLKELRQELEASGVKVPRGIPASMTRRNVATGQSHKKMHQAKDLDHQCANVRQNVSCMLRTMNKNHCDYVCAAFELGLTMMETDMSELLDDYLKTHPDPLPERMAIGYYQSEFAALLGEMEMSSPNRRAKGAILVPFAIHKDSDRYTNFKQHLAKASAPITSLVAPYSILSDVNKELRHSCSAGNLKRLRHLNLTGSYNAVDDDLLDGLAANCNELEFLCFGQDNQFTHPDDVTLDAVIRLCNSCPRLQFLRIFHRCRGKAGDPTGSAFQKALKREGFVLKTIDHMGQLAALKKEIAEDETNFWRFDCEEGFISASWYQRFENKQKEKEFFHRHFCGQWP